MLESLEQTVVPKLPWTGERLVTEVNGNPAIEHLHRYALALGLAHGKSVLDVACGEGYGSNLLAAVADHVSGVDIDSAAIAHAQAAYQRSNVTFRVGSATDLPVPSASVDLVVSFETLEHLVEHDRMMAEVKRVLRPNGTLLISSPDRRTYSDVPAYSNPFHVKELYADEFRHLLTSHFRKVQIVGQKVCHGSVVLPQTAADNPSQGRYMTWRGNYTELVGSEGFPNALYLLGLATDSETGVEIPMSVYEGDDTIRTGLEIGLREALVKSEQENAQIKQDSAREIARLKQEIEHHKTLCQQLRQSLSWRITGPLRATVDGVRRLLNSPK